MIVDAGVVLLEPQGSLCGLLLEWLDGEGEGCPSVW